MSTRQFPKHTVSTTQPTGGQAGDEWFNPATNQLYKLLIGNGNSPEWRELAQPSLVVSSANSWSKTQTFNTDISLNGALNHVGNVTQTGNISLTNTVTATSPVYGSTSTAVSANGAAATINFTVFAGNNRCLVLTLSINDNTKNVNTPTWVANGVTQSFTLLGYAASQKSSIWHLAAPTVGIGIVSVTLTGNSYWEIGVSSFVGVNQSTPMDKFITVAGTLPSSGTAYTIATPYTGIAGELVVSNVSYYSGAGGGDVSAGSSNQTTLWAASSDGGHKGASFLQPSFSSTNVDIFYPSNLASLQYVIVIGSLKSVSVAASTISSSNAQLNLSIGASSYWTLPTGTASLNISNLLVFDTTNNRLGIGQEAPTVTLDVLGAGKFSNGLTVSSGGMAIGTTIDNDVPLKIGTVTSTGQIGLHLVSASGAHLQLTDTSNVDMSIGVLDGQSALSFHTGRNRLSAGTELLRLNSTGEFGIGVSPTVGVKLEVNGTLRLNGTTPGTNYTEIKSAAAATATTYTFPAAAPSVNGQSLTSTTGGTMSWATPSSGGRPYTYIGSVIVSGTAASMSFTSIAATYTDLYVRFASKINGSATQYVMIRFNGDTTTTYQSGEVCWGGANLNNSYTGLAYIIGGRSTASTVAQTIATGEFIVADYANTSFDKMVFGHLEQAGEARVAGPIFWDISGKWNNTAAINAVSLTPFSGSFVTGSYAYLYGRSMT